tara:strand:+ start:133 stop:792 length:660 start_codon:yes stop_codon:yes gene_type:complete
MVKNERRREKSETEKPKNKPDYITENSAWAYLAGEIPQYDLPAMGELYTGFNVGDDPIISQTLMEVSMFKQKSAEHQKKVNEYQRASEEDRKNLKNPGKFQIDPILDRAIQVFEQAKQIYSQKFIQGYSELTVSGAVNWAKEQEQKFPGKLVELFYQYANKKVADLSDKGDEGKVKEAVYAMVPQITQARLLPKLIHRMVGSRLESIVSEDPKNEGKSD